jgi:hypothetical protein
MLFDYFLRLIIPTVYRYPFIHGIVKKSLMGNDMDKTIDYYRSLPLVTIIDEDFIINYTINMEDFSLYCTSDTFEDAILYIKRLKKYTHNPYRRVLSIYEDDGVYVKDVTNTVSKLLGPNGDFYVGTKFESTCSFASSFQLVIITDDLSVYTFKGEDILDISTQSSIKISRNNSF